MFSEGEEMKYFKKRGRVAPYQWFCVAVLLLSRFWFRACLLQVIVMVTFFFKVNPQFLTVTTKG